MTVVAELGVASTFSLNPPKSKWRSIDSAATVPILQSEVASRRVPGRSGASVAVERLAWKAVTEASPQPSHCGSRFSAHA